MKNKSKREKAEKRVIKAAMVVHRTWQKHSYYDGREMYDAVADLDDACSSLHKLPKR